MSAEALEAAVQDALAGEHAAVWASGRSAALLSGDRRTQALRELDRHRRTRDALQERVISLGAVPVQAAPAYLDPFPVTGARSARRLMAHVNSALAATYADMAAASPRGGRATATRLSRKAAVRAVDWGAAARAFPGI